VSIIGVSRKSKPKLEVSRAACSRSLYFTLPDSVHPEEAGLLYVHAWLRETQVLHGSFWSQDFLDDAQWSQDLTGLAGAVSSGISCPNATRVAQVFKGFRSTSLETEVLHNYNARSPAIAILTVV
jgi:hypothetical protein